MSMPDKTSADGRFAQSSRNDYAPIRHLVWTRILDFVREPEAVFWVCVFPVMMTVALGIAFRNKPVAQSLVDVCEGMGAEQVTAALRASPRLQVRQGSVDDCQRRLRTGKTDLVVTASALPSSADQATAQGSLQAMNYQFAFDPARAESVLARAAADEVLQRTAGRKDALATTDQPLAEKGARYVDFLIPGLVGMSIMGGGMWGIGYVIVDLRIRKLLKRFLATPMRKPHFLAGIMIARLVFLIPEVLIVLLFGWLAFGVEIHGHPLELGFAILLGTITFAGIGLLVASRANTMEAVSGLMNVVMLPMWMLSGIFFSSARFPEVIQPVVKLLPLTPVIDMLRGIMQEGTSLSQFVPQISLLVVYMVISFALALRWFRWT